MYGDCQVMSSDQFFTSSSSSPIRNPNFNFMTNMPFLPYSPIIPKEELGGGGLQQQQQMRIGVGGGGKEEEMMESGSGSGHVDGGGGGGGGGSADEQEINEQKPKKKRYHRHTARQIQEMEALFKECPHPDDKQRMKLSQDLGLKPRQVKFWFQNRRTQMKAQQDRSDNVILRTENDNLKNDNFRLQAALRNIICPNCNGPAMLGEMSFDEQHLRLENARLKDELERLSCVASRYNIRPIQALGPLPHHHHPLVPSLDLDMGIYSRHFQEPPPPMDMTTNVPQLSDNPHNSHLDAGFVIMEQEKPLAMEFAMNAMDELVKMCQATEPLWVRCNNNNGNKQEVLNVEEHGRLFPWPMNLKQQNENDQFRREATRDSAVVIMNSITLVDAFLDVNKWIELFPSIVARAKTVQIITSGVSGHASGSLHLMHAELQVLSPLVPTRESHFLRYCHQNVEEGTWVIVDFPIDNFPDSNIQTSFLRYRRRPSGCIIQDMPNGYSRVVWVEHAEVEDKPVHQIFNQLVNSGMAFGAQRWLAVLQQQCERLASLMARNLSNLGVIPTSEARKNLMKLAQRMIRTFCFNVSPSGGQTWTALQDSSIDTVRITTRRNMELGQPNGFILCAVTTSWLPFSHHQVFDFLRDERRRSQLDVLSSGTSSHEVDHIANGSHPGNCISLLRINAASNSSQNVELMLQESSTDGVGSLVVYTTIDVEAVQLAMSGEDPSYIPILPLGFIILPVNSNNNADNGNTEQGINGHTSGCLLTVGLQVLASTNPGAKLSLSSATAINNHICSVVRQINNALSNNNNGNGNGNGNGSPVCGGVGSECAEPNAATPACEEQHQ